MVLKLRKVNRKKYCVDCGLVEIELNSQFGYCPSCKCKLYNLKADKNEKQKNRCKDN